MPTNTTVMRALAIGPSEILSGLGTFGVEIRHTVTKDDALNIVNEIRSKSVPTSGNARNDENYAIIFITESLVKHMSDNEYMMLMGDALPVILTIPDLTSQPDAGLKKLANLTKRAVGVDIFSK